MSQLTPADRREFLKSVDTEWQTLVKNQAAEMLKLETVGQIVRWTLVGLVSGSQTTARHLDVGPRHDSS